MTVGRREVYPDLYIRYIQTYYMNIHIGTLGVAPFHNPSDIHF